jgi:hypothetical protein
MCRITISVFLALILTPRIVLASPILSSAPTISSVALGATIAVPIQISDVAGLFAYQFDASYDPAVLQLNSITEGTFLPSAGSTFFVPGYIDNTSGLASFTADTLLGAIAGASGSGTLASLDFTAEAPGLSSLNLSNVVLLNTQFSDIPFVTNSGTVSVSSVPTPGTIWLIFAGVPALLLGRR